MTAFSQNAEQLARTELQRRGLDENQVRERLKQRGIDIDNIKPEQLPALQPAIEAVISEIEQENKTKAGQATPTQDTPAGEQRAKDKAAAIPEAPKTPEQKKADELTKEIAPDVQENLKAGASVEEAVSEALAERIQEKLLASGAREVPSTRLGELVMRELKRIDKVAYVRFASVYRSFEDVDEFRQLIRDI